MLLILAGFAQAAASAVSAPLLILALARSGAASTTMLLGAVVVAALAVGVLRMAERALSERLSQHYVHEIRMGPLRRNLSDGSVSSHGIAIARTTNDLSWAKNWVRQGVAPLAPRPSPSPSRSLCAPGASDLLAALALERSRGDWSAWSATSPRAAVGLVTSRHGS